MTQRTLWIAVSGLAALAASSLTRSALKKGWNTATGDDPPLNPASTETAWTEALVWTVAASVVAGVSRLLARRTAAHFLDGGVPTDRYD